MNKKKPNRNDPRFLNSVSRGMEVIECLSGAIGAKSLTEIAQTTGLTIPTLQRLITTLVEAGYVDKTPLSKRYSLTVRTLDLLYFFLSRNSFAKTAWPHMVRLRSNLQLDVSLSLPLEDTMIYLHRLPKYRGIFDSTLPGKRVPLHLAASGHIYLATQTEEQIKLALDAMAPQNFDRDVIWEQIMRSRLNGYGLVEDKNPSGLISIACPIIREGKFKAGISAHVPWSVFSSTELIDRSLQQLSIVSAALSI